MVTTRSQSRKRTSDVSEQSTSLTQTPLPVKRRSRRTTRSKCSPISITITETQSTQEPEETTNESIQKSDQADVVSSRILSTEESVSNSSAKRTHYFIRFRTSDFYNLTQVLQKDRAMYGPTLLWGTVASLLVMVGYLAYQTFTLKQPEIVHTKVQYPVENTFYDDLPRRILKCWWNIFVSLVWFFFRIKFTKCRVVCIVLLLVRFFLDQCREHRKWV